MIKEGITVIKLRSSMLAHFQFFRFYSDALLKRTQPPNKCQQKRSTIIASS